MTEKLEVIRESKFFHYTLEILCGLISSKISCLYCETSFALQNSRGLKHPFGSDLFWIKSSVFGVSND